MSRSCRITVVAALLVASSLFGWAAQIQVGDPATTRCQKAIRAALEGAGDGSPEVSFGPADRHSISKSEQGVRGQATVTSVDSRLQVAYECTFSSGEGRLTAASFRQTATSARVDTREVIRVCQQAIANKAANTGRVEFGDPAEAYSVSNREQGVRGKAVLVGKKTRHKIAYECTVDFQRTRVLTANYRPVSSTGDRVQLDGLSVRYQVHVQGHGWMDWARDGEPAGTTGRDLRIEALRIELENRGTTGVAYQVHVAGRGWSDWVENGAVAGTTGEERRVEAVRVRLVDAPKSVRLRYQVHAQGAGWMEWVDEGELAGTTGQSRRLEAIRVELVRD